MSYVDGCQKNIRRPGLDSVRRNTPGLLKAKLHCFICDYTQKKVSSGRRRIKITKCMIDQIEFRYMASNFSRLNGVL